MACDSTVIVNQAAIISISQPFFSYLIESDDPFVAVVFGASQRKPDQSRRAVTEDGGDDGRAKRCVAEEEGVRRVGFICCVIAMDCPISTGPFGVLECLSHEIIEKVAMCLDLDNLKKLSKVSTAFRSVATSVRFRFLHFLFAFGSFQSSYAFSATCLVFEVPRSESQANHRGGKELV